MKKYNGFFDLDHVRMYLNNSIIMIENEPCVINEVNSDGEWDYILHYSRIGIAGIREIEVTNTSVSFIPIKLGLVNILYRGKNKTFIMRRRPNRMWKIGLNNANMVCTNIVNPGLKLWMHRNILFSRELYKTVQGDFPTVEKILDENTLKNTESIAFNREFLIHKYNRKLLLWYFNYNVPVGKIKRNKPQLSNEFLFLKEKLEGILNEQ